MRQMRAADRRAVESRIVERRWRERVAAWRRSGQDERVFCRREKVGVCALRWWVKRLDAGTPGQVPSLQVTTPANKGAGTRPASNVADARGALKWERLSAEWESSGLRQTEFCRQRGLAVHTLRWWRWRLRGDEGRPRAAKAPVPVPAAPPTVPTFVPVQVVAEPLRPRCQQHATMEIVLRRRRRVRVGADFDARLLARVVRVLEAIP